LSVVSHPRFVIPNVVRNHYLTKNLQWK
jgi:hypothetical protein